MLNSENHKTVTWRGKT